MGEILWLISSSQSARVQGTRQLTTIEEKTTTSKFHEAHEMYLDQIRCKYRNLNIP